MNGPRLSPTRMAVAGLSIYLSAASAPRAEAQWLQWGGSSRNFVVETEGLANSWPKDGPKELWRRQLGDGYSSILCDEGMLFTQYRKTRTDEEEITVALDAKTGRTIWEHKIPSILKKPVSEWGYGPNSTPLIAGRRLFVLGTNGVLQCFDKRSGSVLWKHDLIDQFDSPAVDGGGYTSSPIAYKSSVILAVGKKKTDDDDEVLVGPAAPAPSGQSLIAFDQESGDLLWQSLDFHFSMTSPILITFDGQDQLVFPVEKAVLGIDPNDGRMLWRQAMEWQDIISTPIWDGDHTIIVTRGGGEGGTLAIQLTSQGGRTVPEELWSSRKARVSYGTPVRSADFAYVPTDQAMIGLDLKTGRRAWYERGFASASCVLADGKLIILDENGQLTLATPLPKELTIHAQHQLTERHSLTPPTLVGTTLFVRDRKQIMALDLG